MCAAHDFGSGDNVECVLIEEHFLNDQNVERIGWALVHSSAVDGSGVIGTFTGEVSYSTPVVDNSMNSYFLRVTLPPNGDINTYAFFYAVIEYEYLT